MFRCQMCNAIVPPKTRMHRIVLKQRSREYQSRGPDPDERRRGGFGRGRGRRPSKKDFDKGGSGHEIVRELLVCPECAEKFQAAAKAEADAVAATQVEVAVPESTATDV